MLLFRSTVPERIGPDESCAKADLPPHRTVRDEDFDMNDCKTCCQRRFQAFVRCSVRLFSSLMTDVTLKQQWNVRNSFGGAHGIRPAMLVVSCTLHVAALCICLASHLSSGEYRTDLPQDVEMSGYQDIKLRRRNHPSFPRIYLD